MGAKVRLSEQNTKGKLVFLCILERKYLRRQSKVRLSEQNTKGKLVFKWPKMDAIVATAETMVVSC